MSQPPSSPQGDRRFVTVATIVLALAPTWIQAEGTLPFASLDAYVADRKAAMPGPGSDGFIVPSQPDTLEFAGCLRAMFAGNATAAGLCLDPLGYDLGVLYDTGALRSYLIATERLVGARGQGSFVVDTQYARNVVLAVPHPLFDGLTPEVATRLFQDLQGRALFLAGTHRCANAAPTPCDGATTTCGGVYRISDTAHVIDSFLQGAHGALRSVAQPPIAVSVHGQASEPVDVVLSDGTRNAAPASALVNRLRDALLLAGVPTGSCNWPADLGLSLCGTTNTQGRLLNGSPEPCGTPATGASGSFLHMELAGSVRADPAAVSAALLAELPIDAWRLLAVRRGVDVELRFARSATAGDLVRDVDPRFTVAPIRTAVTGPAHVDLDPPGQAAYYRLEP